MVQSSRGNTMSGDLSYSQIEYLVDEWIHNGKYRAIAKRKLHNKEVTFEQLAEEFGYSVNQTKNIVKEAKQIIMTHIGDK